MTDKPSTGSELILFQTEDGRSGAKWCVELAPRALLPAVREGIGAFGGGG
jgi:hypothetical protein